MILTPNASEIPTLFVEVFQKAFDLDFERYLDDESRGFIALVISNENPEGLLAARCRLDEQPANALAGHARTLGLPKAFGAYFTPSRFPNSPLEHDVLVATQRWSSLDSRGRTAIAYHEACHCLRESKLFQTISATSAAYRGGQHYRKFTRYHDDNGWGHDPQWFALLVEKAQAIQSEFPHLFTSSHDVIESGLSADLLLSEGEFLPKWKAQVGAV